MHDPRSVARAMIERAEAQGLALSHLKLQKLLYLAHGLMLARYGKPLVNEPFKAWKYGPVLESLYHELKIFGPGPIASDRGFIPCWPSLPDDARHETEAIDDVLRQCGGMSGGQLVALSHDPNGPWHAVYHAETPTAIDAIDIDDDAIGRYFETLVESGDAPPAPAARRSAAARAAAAQG